MTARKILSILAIIGYVFLTGGFFVLLFFGDQVKLPAGQLGNQIVGMLGMVVGTWTSCFTMIFTFNFGTSQGSQDKGDLIKEKLLKPADKIQ